jgi:hypothetical protein
MLIASPTEQDADMFFSHYLLYYLSVDVEQLPGNSLPVATMDGAVQGVSVQTSPSCKNSIRWSPLNQVKVGNPAHQV